MATIDSLDIQISGSVQKANDAIDSLITNLGRLAKSLKIDTSGLANIGKMLNLEELGKSAKTVESQMQKISKSASEAAKEFQDRFKDIDVKVDFSKPESELRKFQKQAQNAENSLSRVMVSSSADKSIGAIEKLSITLAQANNAVKTLENHMKGLQTAHPQADFNITGAENATKFLVEYKKQLIDLKNDIKAIENAYGGFSNVPKGGLDTPIQNLIQSIEELKRSYPQAANIVSAFEKELQKIQGISARLTREPIKVNVDTNSIDRINEKIAELKEKFANVGMNFKFKGTFEQLNSEIERVYSKLNAKKLEEQQMISAGKVDTSNFEKLEKSLSRLENKSEILQDLKNRTEKLKSSLSNLQVPPIQENNLEKLQNALKRTEADAAKLKTSLTNEITMGRIIPNIDDSGFRRLTEQIALSEKQAEALRAKIQEVGGDTSGARGKFDKLKEVLSKFSAQSSKASSSSNVLEKSIKKLSSSMNGIGKSARKAISGMKSFARQALSGMGIYLTAYGAVKGIRKSIESSMDYIEILNYFNAAFRQVAEKADLSSFKEMGYNSAEEYYNSFAERAKELTQKMTGFTIKENGMLESGGMKSLGINPAQLMNYQAMFAQMSSSMGVTSENASKLSVVLTEIGADLASVKNMKFEKVWNDMASGLAGMSRTLDKYGANIRNVNLQQKLNEIGIKANISALNQNDKALLRTIILLDSTRYAWGDLAKTINQPANQLRLLQSNFSNLARTIGNIFLPIVAKVLPYINMLVQALTRLAEWLAKLFGFEDFEWGGGGGNVPDILGDIYDSAEDTSGALDKVSDSAKKAKAGLRAFDELKTINMPESEEPNKGTGGAGTGGAGAGVLQGALDKILDEYQAAWDKAFSEMEDRANTFADNVAKAFKEKGLYGVGKYLSESITKALENIPWDSAYEGARNFGKGLADFLNGSISPTLFLAVGSTVAGSINTALHFLDSLGERFDFANFGTSIGAGINAALGRIDWKTALSAAKNWGIGIAKTINNFFKTTDFSLVGETLANTLNTAMQFVLNLGATLDFKQFGKSIAKGINIFFSKFDFAKLARTLNAWAKGILKAAITAIDKVDWGMIGKQIGKFLASLDIMDILGKIAILVEKAAKAFADAWIGAFKKAPLETLLVSLWAIPNALKAIIGSKFVGGIANLANNFLNFGKNVGLAASGLAGNQSAIATLSASYPRLGKAVEVARQAFANFRFGIESGNFFTGIDQGITTIRNNLTGLQKGAITAVAGFAEFNIVSDAFEGLTLGTEDLISGIGKIAGAVAIAGAAMYTALGPAGLAIAAVVGVVAAIKGINDAFDEIRAEEIGNAIKNAMTTPGGVALSEITSGFTEAFSEAASGFDVIKEKSAEMDNVQKNVKDTWTEIYKIQEAMDNGVLSVEEGKQELERLFGELATLTETKFSTMNTAIMSAYGDGGSFRAALDNLGLDTEAAIDTMITYGYENSERAKQIAQELAGMDINSDDYKRLTAELASLTGEMSSFEKATSDFTYDMNSLQGKIDYSEIFLEDGSIDTEALQGYLNEASSALNEYENSLDDAGKEISQYWQEIYNSTTATDEQKAIAKANLDYIPQAIEDMKTEAQLKVVGFTDLIQTEFISKTGDVIANAQKEWNSKTDWDKFWSGVFGPGTEGEYAKEAVDKMEENFELLSSTIEESFGGLSIEGVGWASDVGKEITGALFDTEYIRGEMGGHYSYTLNESYREMINEGTEGLSELAQERGKNAVTGYAIGFEDNSSLGQVRQAAVSLAEIAMGAIAETQDSHSPSKVTEGLGKDAVDGYGRGISNNQQSTRQIAISWMQGITGIFSDWAALSKKNFSVWGEETKNNFGTWKIGTVQQFSEWGTQTGKEVSNFSQSTANKLSSWNTATSGNIENWKNTNFNKVANWANETQNKIEGWKNTTQNTISGWNTTTQGTINTWKTETSNSASAWSQTLQDTFTAWSTNTQGTTTMWYDQVREFFLENKWNFGGIREGLNNAFNSAVDSIKGIWNSFANWLNDKLTWTIDPITIMGYRIFDGATINLGRIPTFQTGGFPEDGLFMANRGELVGKFANGKTAVANNEQIVSGIAEAVYPAVYNAVSSAMKNNAGSANVTFQVEGDPNGLFRVVKKEWRNEANRTRKNPVPVY